jgi:type 1 glutamine amidotransferase
MKKRILSIALGTLASVCLLVAQNPKPAQPEKPKTWEEKAAERFGANPTAEHKAQIEANLPTPSKPAKDHKILVFYRCEGFIHTSIPFCNYAMKKIAETTGAFSADFADQYSVFTKENLARYDAIVFNNTTGLKPDDAQKAAILDFINGGKGIVGFHAAADNFGGWEEGIALIGGIFNGHPWNAGGTWSFKVEDPAHPLNAAFGGKGFWHKDEIYWYKTESFQGREKLRVLLSLDMSKAATRKPIENEKEAPKLGGKSPSETDVAVSWCREVGKGRLFFTNLGHNDLTFANKMALQHMVDGIQYALRDLDADATPSSKVKVEVATAPEQP